MLAASARSIADLQGQSAAVAGRRHRRGDPVPGMADRRQFHVPGRARLHAHGQGARACARRGDRARHAARRDVPVLTRGGQVVSITPEMRAFFDEPKTLIVTKANVRSRVHRRVYMDYVGVKRFDADGKPIGEFRIVGLFTSTVYTRSTRTIPYLRRKVDAVLRRAGFDSDGHSGKALVNVLETYPRDELFQIDEDTLLSVRARDPAARRAPARARAGAPRPLRPLRVGAGLRAARALQRASARGDRRVSRRGLQGPRQRLLSVFPRRPAGPRAFHHRARRGPDAQSRHARRSRTASARSCAPGATRSSRRWRQAHDPAARARAVRALPRRASPRATATPIRPSRRSPTSAMIEGAVGGSAARRRFLSAQRGGRPCVGLKVWSHRPADPALGARAGAGEHGLPRGRRAHLRESAAPPMARRHLAARHDAGARRRRTADLGDMQARARRPASSW